MTITLNSTLYTEVVVWPSCECLVTRVLTVQGRLLPLTGRLWEFLLIYCLTETDRQQGQMDCILPSPAITGEPELHWTSGQNGEALDWSLLHSVSLCLKIKPTNRFLVAISNSSKSCRSLPHSLSNHMESHLHFVQYLNQLATRIFIAWFQLEIR